MPVLGGGLFRSACAKQSIPAALSVALAFLCLSWKALSLGLQQITALISFEGKDPTTANQVLGLDLPSTKKVKHLFLAVKLSHLLPWPLSSSPRPK